MCSQVHNETYLRVADGICLDPFIVGGVRREGHTDSGTGNC